MDVHPLSSPDLDTVRALIAASVRGSVVQTEEDAQFILHHVDEALAFSTRSPGECMHLGAWVNARLAGVILVKKHWNLTNLFVHPEFQRRGVGRALVHAVLPACRVESPKGKLMVNSSTVAVPFYRALAFVQTGPGLDRPGGCVPLELVFARQA